MNVLCLGGAGKICSEAVLDLVAYSDFNRITIADIDQKAGEALAASIDIFCRLLRIFLSTYCRSAVQ